MKKKGLLSARLDGNLFGVIITLHFSAVFTVHRTLCKSNPDVAFSDTKPCALRSLQVHPTVSLLFIQSLGLVCADERINCSVSCMLKPSPNLAAPTLFVRTFLYEKTAVVTAAQLALTSVHPSSAATALSLSTLLANISVFPVLRPRSLPSLMTLPI